MKMDENKSRVSYPGSLSSTSLPTTPTQPQREFGGSPSSQPQNLRSSVSMFIEDSRITAVANAEPPPTSFRPSSSSQTPSSSFYSVTSFSTSTPTSVLSRRASWNLRPTFSQLPSECPPGIKARPRACSSSPVRFFGGNSPGGSRGGSTSREIIHNIIREEHSGGAEGLSPFPPSAYYQHRHSSSSHHQQVISNRPPAPRKRTTLNVEPEISVINVKENLPPLPLRQDDGRGYTSVNLTLRSPTSSSGAGPSGIMGPTLITSTSISPSRRGSSLCGGEVGGASGSGVNVVNTVVDMDAGGGYTTFRHVHSSSSGGGGGGSGVEESHHLHHPSSTNLTYSTYSNSSDGFEAQVQIQFGPGGGTFTASRRRRNHNISIRQMNPDLLGAQTERKDKLRSAIHDKRCLLATLQTEIVQLRSQLQQQSPFHEVDSLKRENQRLRVECDFMAREVDLYQHGSVPLGETDEEFYQGINPGQSIDAVFGSTNNRRRLPGSGRGGGGRTFGPPPRPPPPKFLQSPARDNQLPSGGAGIGGSGGLSSPEGEHPQQHYHQHPREGDPGDEEAGEWRCSMCTFQNHRDLDYCEQCQMVRVKNPQTLHGPS